MDRRPAATTRGSSKQQEGRPCDRRGAGLGEGTGVTLAQGAVVLVELDPTVGHEQRGVRRCIAEEALAHWLQFRQPECKSRNYLR
jgi:hypothetical protein